MTSVWKRLQRVNKRAAKFQFTASFHELRIESTPKWRPTTLHVVWTRRSRRVVSSALPWEPDLVEPLTATMYWPVPDNHSITVTLFRDARTRELEDKDWTFAIEDVSPMAKKRILATKSINMRDHASIESTQQTFTIQLRPTSKKIVKAELVLTLSCVFLREGKATDEDMESIASIMSMNNNDIAPLDELEDIPDLEVSEEFSEEIHDMTHQLEQLTSSLNSSELGTPISVPSLTEDRTPIVDTYTSMIDSNKNYKKEGSGEDGPGKFDESPRPEIKLAVIDETEIDLDDEPQILAEIKEAAAKLEILARKDDDDDAAIVRNGEVTTKPLFTKPVEKTKIELLPLNLKKNYENETQSKTAEPQVPTTTTATATLQNLKVESSNKGTLERKTPGQDLLEWCKEVTKDYAGVKVTNFNTSWRNGKAFCAVIHKHQPELIGDISNLKQEEVKENCRRAFEAAESLGIPKLIDPEEMAVRAVPDKLTVMTYLHQLRAYFTGNQLEIERLGADADDTAYVIGNYRTDSNAATLLNLKDLKLQLKHRNSFEEEMPNDLSPSSVVHHHHHHQQQQQAGHGNLLAGTQHKRESPIKEISFTYDETTKASEPLTPMLDVKFNSVDGTPPSPPGFSFTSNNILRRHTELSEKAKEIIGKLKSPSGENHVDPSLDPHETDRQARLREEARALIAETRKKSLTLDLSTPIITSPTKLKKGTLSPEKTISPINNLKGIILDANMAQEILTAKKDGGSPMKDMTNLNTNNVMKIENVQMRNSPSKGGGGGKIDSVSLQSFNAMFEKLSPRTESKLEKADYYQSELDALEREQEHIDLQARALEKKLRSVMDANSTNTKENEDKLMAQWFTLVNKKNALLRRQMQLNILEQENDLERKFQMLTLELRAAASVEEWRKTEEQREREQLLLEELVKVVNKRDELVKNYDTQEQALADDEEIQSDLEHIDLSHKDEKCVIQ